jgi:hypothetical protein
MMSSLIHAHHVRTLTSFPYTFAFIVLQYVVTAIQSICSFFSCPCYDAYGLAFVYIFVWPNHSRHCILLFCIIATDTRAAVRASLPRSSSAFFFLLFMGGEWSGSYGLGGVSDFSIANEAKNRTRTRIVNDGTCKHHSEQTKCRESSDPERRGLCILK